MSWICAVFRESGPCSIHFHLLGIFDLAYQRYIKSFHCFSQFLHYAIVHSNILFKLSLWILSIKMHFLLGSSKTTSSYLLNEGLGRGPKTQWGLAGQTCVDEYVDVGADACVDVGGYLHGRTASSQVLADPTSLGQPKIVDSVPHAEFLDLQ